MEIERHRLVNGSVAAIAIALDTAPQLASLQHFAAGLLIAAAWPLEWDFHCSCSGPTRRMLDRKREAKV